MKKFFLPALQRNQRDDARKRDVSNVVAAIETYFGNSGNSSNLWPAAEYVSLWSSPMGSYLNKNELSKNTDEVTLYPTNYSYVHSQSVADGGKIDVYFGKQCDGSGGKIKDASSRSAAVVTQIEAGNSVFSTSGGAKSGAKFYCQDAS